MANRQSKISTAVAITVAPPSPGPGRPATGVERVQVRLHPSDIELARTLGEGNVSAGIRRALAEFLPAVRPARGEGGGAAYAKSSSNSAHCADTP